MQLVGNRKIQRNLSGEGLGDLERCEKIWSVLSLGKAPGGIIAAFGQQDDRQNFNIGVQQDNISRTRTPK